MLTLPRSTADVHACPLHELSWPPLLPREQAASPKQWPDIFGLLTLLTGQGTRQQRQAQRQRSSCISLACPKAERAQTKPFRSCEILRQCLTEEKTPVLFLDKRINKIKRLPNHQWKIGCHFDSTLKHEAGASSSFHLSCNAIILAPNGDGCHGARLLSYCAA